MRSNTPSKLGCASSPALPVADGAADAVVVVLSAVPVDAAEEAEAFDAAAPSPAELPAELADMLLFCAPLLAAVGVVLPPPPPTPPPALPEPDDCIEPHAAVTAPGFAAGAVAVAVAAEVGVALAALLLDRAGAADAGLGGRPLRWVAEVGVEAPRAVATPVGVAVAVTARCAGAD